MIYLILMLIVSLGVALFAVQNAMMVEVSFMAWKFSTSLVMVIFGSLFAGMLIALFWMLKMKAQHYLQDKKLREQVGALENEKAKLNEEIKMLMHTQRQRVEAQQQPTAAANEVPVSKT